MIALPLPFHLHPIALLLLPSSNSDRAPSFPHSKQTTNILFSNRITEK
ncbi:MAG: hypothetical protein RI580_09465 [Halothece sp. Uz-M2-17]|nr:hypothetical protein [Halothece sp. Uz-M2-17]